MKIIKLTQGQIALVDDDIHEELNQYKWCAIWDEDIKGFYAARNIRKENGKYQLRGMHRVITDAPKGKMVDHINCNQLDNQCHNLRIVSSRENQQNLHKNKRSKFPGVCWNKGVNKWQSQIRINGKRKHLGIFTSEQEAFSAYLKACKDNLFETDFMLEQFGIK